MDGVFNAVSYSFHRPRLSLMGPTYHPRPHLFSTARPSPQRCCLPIAPCWRTTPPRRNPKHADQSWSRTTRASPSWIHAAATPRRSHPLAQPRTTRVSPARVKEQKGDRQCVTRTKRYAPVPSIPRAGSIPHLRGIFLKWGDPILIQTPPIFGSTHPILETKHRLKGRQQQHSLLSQASWGRLEMKPKRDEKQT
jgi:hypothetical protein